MQKKKKNFKKSVEAVKDLFNAAKKIDPDLKFILIKKNF